MLDLSGCMDPKAAELQELLRPPRRLAVQVSIPQHSEESPAATSVRMESRSSQYFLDDFSMNIGEPLLTPAKSIRQLLVI